MGQKLSIEELPFKGLSVELLDTINQSTNRLGYWELSIPNMTLVTSEKFSSMFKNTPVRSIKDLRSYVGDQEFIQLQVAIDSSLSKKQRLDVKIHFKTFSGEKTESKVVRLVGLHVCGFHGEDLICGVAEDITEDEIKNKSLFNKNVELSSYEKGLEQFTIVARTDARGKITYANDEFCRVSKYTIDELLGKDHRILNSHYHPKEFFTEMWNCILSGKSWRGIIRNRAKDGTFYWVDTVIIPIVDSDGKLIEISSFRFDVTKYLELKSENEDLKKQIQQLEEALVNIQGKRGAMIDPLK